jgi:hypothetical protein
MTKERIMLNHKVSSEGEAHIMHRPSHRLGVNVLATLNEDVGVDFQISWNIDGGNTFSGPIFLPRDSGYYDVDFDLDDRTGLRLKFMPSIDDAIWINSAYCPYQGAGNDEKGQIKDKDHASNSKLKLKNENFGDSCVLHYRLRFDGDAWTSPCGNNFAPPYSKDPEFRNGGGN